MRLGMSCPIPVCPGRRQSATSPRLLPLPKEAGWTETGAMISKGVEFIQHNATHTNDPFRFFYGSTLDDGVLTALTATGPQSLYRNGTVSRIPGAIDAVDGFLISYSVEILENGAVQVGGITVALPFLPRIKKRRLLDGKKVHVWNSWEAYTIQRHRWMESSRGGASALSRRCTTRMVLGTSAHYSLSLNPMILPAKGSTLVAPLYPANLHA